MASRKVDPANKAKLWEAIESVKDIPAKYTLYSGDLLELCNSSTDTCQRLVNAYCYGFAQGMKAAKK